VRAQLTERMFTNSVYKDGKQWRAIVYTGPGSVYTIHSRDCVTCTLDTQPCAPHREVTCA
jgi:hypothetical protein